jgi:hypothetical protein
MSRILTKAEDIRQWAEARAGNPALEDRPIGAPQVLRIVFDQYALNAGENQYQDRAGGLDLVGWDEWFIEFDRQNLALKVDDEAPGLLDSDYEFVSRDEA